MQKRRLIAKWFLLIAMTGTTLPAQMCGGIDVYSMLYKYIVNDLSDTLTGAIGRVIPTFACRRHAMTLRRQRRFQSWVLAHRSTCVP